MKTISIVVVSWNSGGDLEDCVASLAAARRSPGADAGKIELVVVDNHSDFFPEKEIRAAWPDARLAILGENLGFGPAANHGAAHARGEIVLFLNPDTRAVEAPFERLSKAFEEHAEWVAVAPRLLDELSSPRSEPTPLPTPPRVGEGETQSEFQLRRLPTLASALRELLLIDRAFPRNRGRIRDRYLDRERETSFEVEQPAAAALAVRKSAFDSIAGFDKRFVPAWWEDVDLCRRLLEKGKIVYLPEAKFRHAGGRAMRRLGYDRFLPIYYGNALAYWRKTFSRGSVGSFRLALAAGMLLRIALLPFRRSDPRPKRESLRAYLGALSVALEGK